MDNTKVNELKLLVNLQEQDMKIDSIHQDLERLPVQIEELQKKLDEEKQSFEAIKTDFKKASVKHKEKEGELSAKEQEVLKFNQELNSIKTNEAYKAMLTQIDAAKKEQGLIEDQILEFLETNEANKKKVKKLEDTLKQTEAGIQKEIGENNTTISSLKSELTQREDDRKKFAETIPEEIRNTYEHIRRGKDGLAIVAIQDNSCTGCHYKLPPQKINDAAKGREVVVCEHCSRILFYTKPADSSENK